MKWISFVFVFALLASCTILECDDPRIFVRLEGFSRQELDRVEIIRYVKGSGVPVDTMIEGSSIDSASYTTFQFEAYKDHDLSVRVINTGHVYKLTAFRTNNVNTTMV